MGVTEDAVAEKFPTFVVVVSAVPVRIVLLSDVVETTTCEKFPDPMDDPILETDPNDASWVTCEDNDKYIPVGLAFSLAVIVAEFDSVVLGSVTSVCARTLVKATKSKAYARGRIAKQTQLEICEVLPKRKP